MNTFMNELEKDTNYALTENGAVTHKSTLSFVYDMFAFGGAYRKRSADDIITLFKDAYEEEDKTLALKCLFYLRDCRGGQGERRFFRVAFNWLAKNHPETALRLIEYVSEFGRWDDVIYTTIDTPIWSDVVSFVEKQLRLDLESKTPSLLGKWMPSENASSYKTKKAAKVLRETLGVTSREYRKMLSMLRKKINIVERLMSENRWDEIEFDKIPSKAGLIYKNAFARRDIIAQKYKAFATNSETKVNAGTLYPYDVVKQALSTDVRNQTDRAMINKYWDNLPDYFDGKKCNMMCVVDTSGSMTWGEGSVLPIHVAISLGLYCAERISGPFANHFISFSRTPHLVYTHGSDFVDKAKRIYKNSINENTNLIGVFELLLRTAKKENVKEEDIPETIVIISDMEIDGGGLGYWFDEDNHMLTDMELMRHKWEAAGFIMPKLVYWNVDARNNNILDLSPDVSYVSGCSPIIFEQVMTGKTGYDLMLQTLNTDRYACIK